MTYFATTKITTADTPATDAFGRLRVSQPVTLVEASFEYDLNPYIIEGITASLGSSSFDSNARTANISVGVTAPGVGIGTISVAGTSNPRTGSFSNSQTFSAGDILLVGTGDPVRVITGGTGFTFSVDASKIPILSSSFTKRGSYSALRQRQRCTYEKGKSHLIKQTFLFGSGSNGTTRRAGYYTDRNGVLLTQEALTGSTMVGFIKRSSTTGVIVDTFISQSQWNVDKLDGQGPSGYTLDLTKQQILLVDAQFLGAGRLRMGFDIDGQSVLCHQFLHANTSSIAPYMQTFSLPMTYEIFNHNTGSGADMKCICYEVESEGGTLGGPPKKSCFSAGNAAATGITVTTAKTFVFGIRPKQLVNGLLNRIVIDPSTVSTIIGTNSVLVEVMYDPVLTGGTWTSVDATSGVEYSTNATYSSGGIVMHSFFIGAGSGGVKAAGSTTIAETLPIVLDNFGANPKSVCIVMSSVTSTSVCYATLDWEETK